MDLTPPPGVWLAPRGASQGPAGTNEQVITSPAIVPMGDPPYWKSWKEVPMDPMEVAKFGRWFVEIFSGAARLTQSARNKMIPCLPPIDITLGTEIPVPFDVLDADQWQRFMQLIYFGLIFFAHFGTPCNSYSAARKDDGGPPLLFDRSTFQMVCHPCLIRTCVLFFWVICSTIVRVKHVQPLWIWVVTSLSRTPWVACSGRLHRCARLS